MLSIELHKQQICNQCTYFINHKCSKIHCVSHYKNIIKSKYGKLVDNNGYRVPSDADWTQLTNYLINENWCNDVEIITYNVAQFLKSCRQVDHPLTINF